MINNNDNEINKILKFYFYSYIIVLFFPRIGAKASQKSP